MNKADEVLKLRSDVERAAADVTRLDTLMSAGQEEIDRLRGQLEALGYSPDSDLEAQLGARAAEVERELAGVREGLASLQVAAQ